MFDEVVTNTMVESVLLLVKRLEFCKEHGDLEGKGKHSLWLG